MGPPPPLPLPTPTDRQPCRHVPGPFYLDRPTAPLNPAQALAEDGGKAKKYPPASAEDFATKYVNGKYTYVSNLDTIREKVVGKSGGEDMFADLPDLIEDPVVPGMEDEETAVHPVDVLADMFPDMPRETVRQAWELNGEDLEKAAAGLFTMQVRHHPSCLTPLVAAQRKPTLTPKPTPPTDAPADARRQHP